MQHSFTVNLRGGEDRKAIRLDHLPRLQCTVSMLCGLLLFCNKEMENVERMKNYWDGGKPCLFTRLILFSDKTNIKV